ncbi:MAG: hypothetical protein FWG02_10185, partial [Holophagaceae bacterium]|nr:hypothetical protein [Holophagaceae bacterium]
EQLGMTAMRKQCPQVFENTGFARVCKNFCVSRLIPIKRNLVSVDSRLTVKLLFETKSGNPASVFGGMAVFFSRTAVAVPSENR